EVDLPAVVCPRVLLVLKVTIVGGATGRERPLEVRRVDRREARVHAREQRLRLDDQVSELPRLTPEDDAIESRQVAVLEEQRRQRGTLPAARRAAIQDLATVAVEELLLRSRVGAPVLLNRGSRRTPGLCDPLQPPPRYRGQQVRRVPFRNLLANKPGRRHRGCAPTPTRPRPGPSASSACSSGSGSRALPSQGRTPRQARRPPAPRRGACPRQPDRRARLDPGILRARLASPPGPPPSIRRTSTASRPPQLRRRGGDACAR